MTKTKINTKPKTQQLEGHSGYTFSNSRLFIFILFMCCLVNIYLVIYLLITFHGQAKSTIYKNKFGHTVRKGLVAAPEERCNKIAENIINNLGGSAVDGTISAALCSGVVNSYASGIGGNFLFKK